MPPKRHEGLELIAFKSPTSYIVSLDKIRKLEQTPAVSRNEYVRKLMAADFKRRGIQFENIIHRSVQRLKEPKVDLSKNEYVNTLWVHESWIKALDNLCNPNGRSTYLRELLYEDLTRKGERLEKPKGIYLKSDQATYAPHDIMIVQIFAPSRHQ